MLDTTPMIPTLPAADLDRAKAWYADKLGLTPTAEMGEEAVIYPAGGNPMGFLVYRSGYAGTSQATAASWQVTDIAATMAALRERGVTFEEYDFDELRTVDGVVDNASGKGAWFKDSEGNILSLFQSAGG